MMSFFFRKFSKWSVLLFYFSRVYIYHDLLWASLMMKKFNNDQKLAYLTVFVEVMDRKRNRPHVILPLIAGYFVTNFFSKQKKMEICPSFNFIVLNTPLKLSISEWTLWQSAFKSFIAPGISGTKTFPSWISGSWSSTSFSLCTVWHFFIW